YERLEQAPPADAAYWTELLRALDCARISTIHSFCASLLRSHAVEAGIDPRVAVLEQAQAETLLWEAVDDEVRYLVSRRDEPALRLAERFGLDGLREMLRRMVLLCTPEDFEAWLNVTADEQIERWREAFRELRPTLARQMAESPKARAVAELLRENPPDNDVMRKRRTLLSRALAALAQGPGGQDLGNVLDAIETNARVQGGGGAGAWTDAAAY